MKKKSEEVSAEKDLSATNCLSIGRDKVPKKYRNLSFGRDKSAKEYRTFTRSNSNMQFKDFIKLVNTTQRLPAIGTILVYNEIIKEGTVDRGGIPKGQRGIGVVEAYSRYHLRLKVFRSPQLHERTSIVLTDIELGIMSYIELNDWVYTCSYTYDDLNINCLHPDILKLVKKE